MKIKKKEGDLGFSIEGWIYTDEETLRALRNSKKTDKIKKVDIKEFNGIKVVLEEDEDIEELFNEEFK